MEVLSELKSLLEESPETKLFDASKIIQFQFKYDGIFPNHVYAFIACSYRKLCPKRSRAEAKTKNTA